MHFEFNAGESSASIRGDLVFTDHVAFRQMVDKLLETQGSPLVIDLSELEFIDSAGLGMLLIVREEAQRTGRNLALRRPQGQVKRMFAVTQFDTLFTVLS
jgi:anti-anti-sigma factor